MTRVSSYELERQKRIEENKRRLESIGLKETISNVQHEIRNGPKRQRKEKEIRVKTPRDKRVTGSGPRRRSRRVAGEEPTYTVGGREVQSSPEEYAGGISEEYGMEHVLALGTREKEWELFQDGYDEHGNRVYDKVHGLTCHQCRQKTIGLRTECSKCNSLVGNFCGDCLFMRYGENIEETLGRNDWVCPPCRDLCNCSFHRTRKGWAPTGTLYRRAIAEGFASVAHYLVLTNLKDEDTKRKALPYMPKHLKEEILQELKYTNDDRNCQGDSTKENAKENYACICI